MECIYLKELTADIQRIIIPNEELQHLKALRLKPHEKILATNGRGLQAYIDVISDNGKYYANIIQIIDSSNSELNFRLGLAIGKLDNRDRYEFALEKSIELGITDFYMINCRYSQGKEYNLARMQSKAIAAIKQCKRSVLPNIYDVKKIEYMGNYINDYDLCILADEDGTNFDLYNSKQNILIFVGPEGGFSKEEIDFLMQIKNLKKLKLGNRRLRAETAAIISVGLASLLN